MEFLLDETLRAQFTAEALAAYDEKNESLFCIGVYVFKYLLLKLGPHFGARRLEGGGQFAQSSLLLDSYGPAVPIDRKYLRVSGSEYAQRHDEGRGDAVRSDVQQCHSFRNSPWLITFSRSLASLSRNARYFENRSLIPNIIGAIDGSHVRVAPPKRNEQS